MNSGQAARHWDLFADWCAATGHRPLPATAQTVTGFLLDVPAGAATVARRFAAIDQVHIEAGHPAPSRQLAVYGPSLPPRIPFDLVATAITSIPVGGWPVGLAGRRDAAVVALVAFAGLSRRRVRTLTLGDDDIPVPAASQGGVCPSCAVVRWRQTLAALDVEGWRQVRVGVADLGETGPDDEHICGEAVHLGGANPGLPLFCAIDQHGVPELGTGISSRSITAIFAERCRHAAVMDTGEQAVGAGDLDPVRLDPATAIQRRRDVAGRLGWIDEALDDAEERADALLAALEAQFEGR